MFGNLNSAPYVCPEINFNFSSDFKMRKENLHRLKVIYGEQPCFSGFLCSVAFMLSTSMSMQ